MINTINEKDCDAIHKYLWTCIVDDPVESEKEYRKGSTFYYSAVFCIDDSFIESMKEEDCFEDKLEQVIEYLEARKGHWRGDGYWSDYDGVELDGTLFRVMKVERVITKTVVEWERVE